MEPIEFEIQYSLRDYYDFVAERAAKNLLKGTPKSRDVGAQRLSLLAMLFFVTTTAWALKSGFIWAGLGLMTATLLATINGLVTTKRGYRYVVPFIVCLIAICMRKLRPIYSFRVDDSGIVRHVRGKDYLVPWKEIRRIESYGQAYSVELPKGAVPILYRALSGDQRKSLELAIRTLLTSGC